MAHGAGDHRVSPSPWPASGGNAPPPAGFSA